MSRWLLIVRVCVFSMTAMSAFIGRMLAAGSGAFSWLPFVLASIGLILAHAANNMINDFFDLQSGVDDDAYTRALYAPHPVLSGLVSQAGLLRAILLVNLFDTLIMFYLTWLRGWPVLAFSLLLNRDARHSAGRPIVSFYGTARYWVVTKELRI